MAAGNGIRVDIEALAGSAAHVAGQGEDLATAHMSSDDRIATAQSGWVGSSGAALQTRTAAWLETSRRLLTNVGDHALSLNNDGISFTTLEQHNVERLRAVHPDTAGPADLA
ncbi:WXG100 family type VII secretion target [Mycobacterium sp.]|uniref:WXG100 family type VII secretion target n=1 Tax=Mycobacterium sp. TaxID=1785 RepID=UPI0025FEF509|nr:WXG100 family type VII secretion target [Mycobacterium sp.]